MGSIWEKINCFITALHCICNLWHVLHFVPQVLDMWHPIERSQYPEYFARREQRKQEHIEQWEKKYGKPEEAAHWVLLEGLPHH